MNNPFLRFIPTNISEPILVPTPSQGPSPFGTGPRPITTAPIFAPLPPSPFEPPPGGFQPAPPVTPSIPSPIGPDRIESPVNQPVEETWKTLGRFLLLTSPAWGAYLIVRYRTRKPFLLW